MSEEYVGCFDISYARHYTRREYSHSETRHGKEVRYYHCWRAVHFQSGPFAENEEPNKSKIKNFEKIWRLINGE